MRKLISESRGIEKLRELRSAFASEIRDSFEYRAKSCSACESPGKCCRDEHFVNVHITRLEAAAIGRRLDELGEERKQEVLLRAEKAIEKFGLALTGDTFDKTYACPLFESGIGCLVHETAKPLPCIAHACYEKKEDLPPDDLLAERESAVSKLNRRVYGNEPPLTPLPVAIARKGVD